MCENVCTIPKASAKPVQTGVSNMYKDLSETDLMTRITFLLRVGMGCVCVGVCVFQIKIVLYFRGQNVVEFKRPYFFFKRRHF